MPSGRWQSLWRNRRMPWLLLLLLVALAAIALWVFLDYQRTVAALAVKAEYNVTRLTAAADPGRACGLSQRPDRTGPVSPDDQCGC